MYQECDVFLTHYLYTFVVKTPSIAWLVLSETILWQWQLFHVSFSLQVSERLTFKFVSTLCLLYDMILTHWGQVMHICVSKIIIIGSDNGLSHGRCQAIIWSNAGILLIEPLGTNFNEILIKIHIFSFKKINLKMSSGKWWPLIILCLGLNVLMSLDWPNKVTSTYQNSSHFSISNC